MRKILLLALLTFAICFSCKKKDPPPNSPPTTTTTTGGSTTSGATTGGTVGTPTTASAYHGIFTAGEFTGVYAGFPFSAPTAMAYFSSEPVSEPDPETGIEVGSVLINNKALRYDSAGIYSYTEMGLNLSAETWNVNGGNGIPSFTFTNTQEKPSGLNSSAIPTSISKSAGLTLNLGTLANVKTGQFFLSDNSTNMSGTIMLPLSNGQTEIKLTTAQLAGFQEGTDCVIGVSIENHQVRNIEGKIFRFNKQNTVLKQLEIAP